MNTLVTGGKGFIGTHLVEHLKNHKEEWDDVDVLDKRSGNDLHTLPTKYNRIIHLDSMCIVRECIDNPSLCHYRNSHETAHLIEYARKTESVGLFVFFSSSRVLYPEHNPYTTSKKYGELLCKAYSECYGLPYIIIRPSTVFGPGDKSNRVVNRMIKQALTGEDITIYGDANKTLDLTSIYDFIEAISFILRSHKTNAEFNIACGRGVRLIDLANYIKVQTMSHSNILFLPAEMSQPQNVVVDCSAVRSLGWKPLVAWQQCVDDTIAWVRTWLRL